MASAVRVLLPLSPPASASRSPKRRRLNTTTDAALQASATLSEKSAVADVKITSEDEPVQRDDSSSSASKDEGDATLSVQCTDCGQQFEFATDLVAHSQQTRRQQFACKHQGCSKRYSKREHLTRHVEAVHVRGSTHKPFKCELCQARFTYNHGLTRHMKRSHRNVNVPFECAECLMAFKKKSELQAHSYVHTGVLPFDCEECGERFLKRFLLTRHQRKHEANKEADAQVFVCDCGEICFDQDELKIHKQTEHSSGEEEDGSADTKKGTAAHVCLVCDQTFSRKQYLRAHLRTHFESLDDRKQYICPMDDCNKAYTRPSNLMAHYNAVHDERKSKRFACPREGCTARFGYKTVLKHHLDSIHDNPKPPKRRERKSAGILARALGVNQAPESKPAAATDEEEKEEAAEHS